MALDLGWHRGLVLLVSPLEIPRPQAKKVMLVGDFNDWDPAALPLKRHPDGSWTGQMAMLLTPPQ